MEFILVTREDNTEVLLPVGVIKMINPLSSGGCAIAFVGGGGQSVKEPLDYFCSKLNIL